MKEITYSIYKERMCGRVVKAEDLSSSLERGVGSNPAAFNSYIVLASVKMQEYFL